MVGAPRTLATAALGGLLLALSLPPWPGSTGAWLLGVVGAAVVFAAVDGRRLRARMGGGVAAGLGLYLPGLWWMRDFSLPGFAVTVLLESAILAAAMALAPPARRAGPGVRVAAFPAALVVAEAVRGAWPFGGLPLAGIELGQVGGPLGSAARLGGRLLIVGLVGLAGAGLASAIEAAVHRRRAGGEQQATDAGPPTPAVAPPSTAAPAVATPSTATPAAAPPSTAAPAAAGPATATPAAGKAGAAPATAAPALASARARRRRPPPSGRVVSAVAALAVVGVVAACGAAAPDGRADGGLTVAAVQGGGPRGLRAVGRDPGPVFQAHLRAGATVGPGTDLVLWPEDVVDVPGVLAGSPEEEALAALATELRTTLVAGVVEDIDDDRFRNAAVVFGPDGAIVDRYDKVHRVPFGEYIPARSFFDRLADVSAVPRDAIAGRGPGVIDTPAGRLGVLISYEVFFQDRGRAAVRAGGRLLLVPTNASSFNDAQVPAHELAVARLRAMETGRWVVQAAPTGYSAVIDHRGRVLARTGLGQPAVLRHDVGLRTGRTLFVALGPAPVLLLASATLAIAWIRSRKPERGNANFADGVPEETQPREQGGNPC